MRAFTILRSAGVCAGLFLVSGLQAQTVAVFNDSWADGGRTDGADPMDINWWTSASSSGIDTTLPPLGLVTGTSGRSFHGVFTPQSLAVGDALQLTASYTTPTTVATASGSFRVALGSSNGNDLNQNISASSSSPNALYNGIGGYLLTFGIGTGTAGGISFYERQLDSTNGRLIDTTGTGWDSLGSNGDSFLSAANTNYDIVVTIGRVGDTEIQITAEVYTGGTLLATGVMMDDATAQGITSNFDFVAFGATSNTFGSANTQATADNGIDFTNIKLDYIVGGAQAVPEPATWALLVAGGLLAALGWRRRRG